MINLPIIPRVSNMYSPRSGAPVANQYVITFNGSIGAEDVNVEVFQSYNTIIAIKDHSTFPAKVMLDEHDWNYSRTTSKYRSEFLNEGTDVTRRKIKSGEYALGNLNA